MKIWCGGLRQINAESTLHFEWIRMNQRRILKVSRLENLTDGIFAIAMTILVLNITLPLDTTTAKLALVLQTTILEKIFIYAGSFIILGTQWIAMTFQHGFVERLNRPYLWANFLY